MTDLEITSLCAEAMGETSIAAMEFLEEVTRGGWEPLHDDAQAMALVKKFRLSIGFNSGWGCVKNDENNMLLSGCYHFETLNKAICECVANMQKGKK